MSAFDWMRISFNKRGFDASCALLLRLGMPLRALLFLNRAATLSQPDLFNKYRDNEEVEVHSRRVRACG
jgi:hypothetical protein